MTTGKYYEVLEIRSEPSTPVQKSASTFRSTKRRNTFDLGTNHSSISLRNSEPTICCQYHIETVKEEKFRKFIDTGFKVPPFRSPVRSSTVSLEHVIQVTSETRSKSPALNKKKEKKPIRYYAFIADAEEYQEIDVVLFAYVQDVSKLEDTTRTRLTCHYHQQTYQLTYHDRPTIIQVAVPELSIFRTKEEYEVAIVYNEQPTVFEGCGTCELPASPRCIARQRRDFLRRKQNYGQDPESTENIMKATMAALDTAKLPMLAKIWKLRVPRERKDAKKILEIQKNAMMIAGMLTKPPSKTWKLREPIELKAFEKIIGLEPSLMS